MSVAIIGSLNYDLVTYTDRVPEGGETFAAESFETHLGGKGLNEAIATARLREDDSTKVSMIGNIGSDNFGQELKQVLIDTGIDTSYVNTIEGQSGVATILVETSGENRILITAGANGQLKPTLEQYETYFSDVSFVVIQNEYPDTFKTINWLHENKPEVNIAYNPSPFRSIPESILLKIDLLIVNEGEAKAIAKDLNLNNTDDFNKLAETLHLKINDKNIQSIIITMGSKGCVYIGNGESNKAEFISSVKIDKVVDTTGAGDTFFGGVILHLAAGNSLKKSIKFATLASSIVIQSKGAVESIPTFDQVNRLSK